MNILTFHCDDQTIFYFGWIYKIIKLQQRARPQPGVSAFAGEVRRGRSAPPPPGERQLNFGSQSPCASMSASHMAMVVSISSSLAVCGSSSAA